MNELTKTIHKRQWKAIAKIKVETIINVMNLQWATCFIYLLMLSFERKLIDDIPGIDGCSIAIFIAICNTVKPA